VTVANTPHGHWEFVRCLHKVILNYSMSMRTYMSMKVFWTEYEHNYVFRIFFCCYL
jgi:hypothetical protein